MQRTFKRIPTLAIWVVLACAVVAVPLACSSSDSSDDGKDSGTDTAATATTRN